MAKKIVAEWETTLSLDTFIKDFPELVRKALWDEARTIMNESKKQCPVDTGALRTSGAVTMSKPGKDIEAKLTYSTDYAFWVHENLFARHKYPTKAKFLTDPVMARMPHLKENIIERTIKRWRSEPMTGSK